MTEKSTAYRIRTNTTRGKEFTIYINGVAALAYPGETLATVMLASGLRVFRHTTLKGQPRGLYCGMGICYECLVTHNGKPNVRACQTLAQPGDVVECQS